MQSSFAAIHEEKPVGKLQM